MSCNGPGIPQGWSNPSFRSRVLGDPRRALPWMAAKVWLLLLRGVHGQFVHFTLLCWCSFFTWIQTNQNPLFFVCWQGERYRVVSLFAGIGGLDLGLARQGAQRASWHTSITCITFHNSYINSEAEVGPFGCICKGLSESSTISNDNPSWHAMNHDMLCCPHPLRWKFQPSAAMYVLFRRIQDGFFDEKSLLFSDVTSFGMAQVDHLEPEGLLAGWPCQAQPLAQSIFSFLHPCNHVHSVKHLFSLLLFLLIPDCTAFSDLPGPLKGREEACSPGPPKWFAFPCVQTVGFIPVLDSNLH